MDDDATELLGVLPEDGSPIANLAARRRLRWESDVERYWAAHKKLIDARKAIRRRGSPGGLIARLLEPAEAPQQREVEEARSQRDREADLYSPILETLTHSWKREKGLDNFLAAITAYQGRRRTGGSWSRPDITAISKRTFSLLPQVDFDVWTFEVKKFDDVDVKAVYEALAHGRAATRAYAILQVQKGDEKIEVETLNEIRAAAETHGIGVLEFSDPADWETWTESVVPERLTPEPDRLNEFLVSQLPPELRDTIPVWFPR